MPTKQSGTGTDKSKMSIESIIFFSYFFNINNNILIINKIKQTIAPGTMNVALSALELSTPPNTNAPNVNLQMSSVNLLTKSIISCFFSLFIQQNFFAKIILFFYIPTIFFTKRFFVILQSEKNLCI